MIRFGRPYIRLDPESWSSLLCSSCKAVQMFARWQHVLGEVLSFLRATAVCQARHIYRRRVRLSASLSVRLSVTSCCVIKTMQVKTTKSSLWAAAKTIFSFLIILCDKISYTAGSQSGWRNSPRTNASKRDTPLRSSLPLYRLVYSVKTDADRHRLAAYHKGAHTAIELNRTELNWHGLVFDELTNRRAGRIISNKWYQNDGRPRNLKAGFYWFFRFQTIRPGLTICLRLYTYLY